jgi:hypothetical protein
MPGRFSNTTFNLDPYCRHGVDWGIVSQHLGTCSSIEIGPGYYCGLGLERVGMSVLSSARKTMLMAKLMVYGRIADASNGYEGLDRFLRKYLTLPRMGTIIQESVDLMRSG